MVNEILERLDKVRKTGQNKWVACCPVHGDKNPSMGVLEASDGTVVMHCLSCGAKGTEIVQAVGLPTSVLFAEPMTPIKKGKPYYPTVQYPTGKEQLEFDRIFIETHEWHLSQYEKGKADRPKLKDKLLYRQVKQRIETFNEKMQEWFNATS